MLLTIDVQVKFTFVFPLQYFFLSDFNRETYHYQPATRGEDTINYAITRSLKASVSFQPTLFIYHNLRGCPEYSSHTYNHHPISISSKRNVTLFEVSGGDRAGGPSGLCAQPSADVFHLEMCYLPPPAPSVWFW